MNDDDELYELRTFVVPAGAGRIDRALADAFPDLSRARLQALIEEGAVTVDGAPPRPSAKLPVGTVVQVEVPPVREVDLVAEDLPLPLLYADDDLVVVYKPAGMVVHPAAGHPTGTMVNALLHHVPTLSGIGGEHRPGIVHRLDAGTSGVMVVATNDSAHRGLSEQFRVHSIERRYLALVHRTPRFDRGTFRSSLGRDPVERLKMTSVASGGREAITHWEVRSRGDRVALVEAKLETGRTHQVRVHLSEAGHPILGDSTYGRRECVAPAGIRALVDALDHPLLHAWCLAFTHPRTGERLRFTAPPPDDFVRVAVAAGLADRL